ncbi:MAG: hypothetical protein KAT54_06125 [Candidatus Marinimicrobia bacterium]|nr:hypothetical protein [Candidatus Neomarinimicrobiota bacterium]
MDKSKKLLRIVLFYGGLWGITEATLGYLLHFLPCGFSGMFMFPIGFYFMFNAFKMTGKQSAIFTTALVAAAIKLTDLFVPLRTSMTAINPAISIIFESLVVFAFVKVYKENRHYAGAAIISLIWMVILVLAQQFIFKPVEGLYLMPLPRLAGFLVLSTAVSGLTIGTYLKKPAVFAYQFNFRKLSYLQPAAVILLAIVCEIGNSLI